MGNTNLASRGEDESERKFDTVSDSAKAYTPQRPRGENESPQERSHAPYRQNTASYRSQDNRVPS